MAATPIQQTMLSLAFFADLDLEEPYGSDCDGAIRSLGAINTSLETLNTNTAANWTVVWGPAIFSFTPPANGRQRHIDNVMYVVRNGTSNDYAVAIAGTDGESPADAIFEDAIVRITVPWLFGIDLKPIPQISLATSIGLTVLLNVAPPACPTTPIPAAGQKLLTFLASITNSGPVNLYTTGHSLGGALSPTLALALTDLRPLWDPNGAATLLPFAFAGATPGDAAFTAYFQQKFPNGIERIWNALDVVPHAWDVPHLEETPTLYGPAVLSVTLLADYLVARVTGYNYTPLNDEAAAFSGPQQTPTITTISEYLKEADHQHSDAYRAWAGIDSWPRPKLSL